METVVINGQPQISSTFGNRIVTYDGLVDFLAMLKDEIPRMGYNNKHPYSDYVYSAGVGNSIETAKYGKVIGYSNTVYSQNPELFQNFFITGSNNEITSDGKNVFIFGANNTSWGNNNLLLVGEANKTDWRCAHVYIFGEKNCGSLTKDGKIVKHMNLSYGFIAGSTNQVIDSIHTDILGSNNLVENMTYAKIFGYQNTMGDRDASYSNCYIMGHANTLERTANGWSIGYSNKIFDSNHIYLFGYDNGIQNGKNVFVIGRNNGSSTINTNLTDCVVLGHGNALSNTNAVFMSGMNLQQPDDLSERWYPTYVLGTCNEKLSRVINNDPDSSDSKFNAPAVIIGNGYGATDTVYRNLFVLDYNGGVEIANGHLRSQFTFDTHVYVKGELSLGSGSKDTSSACKIVDRNENIDQTRCLLYYDKGFRHVLQPWNDTGVGNYNEAIWNVNDTSTATKETVLHINASNYYTQYQLNDKIITSDTGGTFRNNINRYTHYAPEEIHFHAGKVDNWATIKCGAIDTNGKNIVAGTVEGTSLKTGQVEINNQWVNTPNMKVDSLSALHIKNFDYATTGKYSAPSCRGIYLVSVDFKYDNWSYHTHTAVIAVADSFYMNLKTALFTVDDTSGTTPTFRVLVTAYKDHVEAKVYQLKSYNDGGAWKDISDKVSDIKYHFMPVITTET